MKDLKYTLLFYILFFMTLHQQAIGQNEVDDCDHSYSRKSKYYLSMADSMERMGSSKSISFLKKAIEEDSLNTEAIFKLALNYFNKFIVSQYDVEYASHSDYYAQKAEEGFLRCTDLCESTNDYLAQYYLGEIYFLKKEFKLAGHFLDDFLNNNSNNHAANLKANNYYALYRKWENWQKTDFKDTIVPLTNCNTAEGERFPFITEDGQVLLFKRRYSKTARNSIFTHTVDELFISQVIGIDSFNNWIYTEGEPILSELDTIISSYCISSDKSEIYFSICHKITVDNDFVDDCDIYSTHWDGSEWETPRKLPVPINLGLGFESYPSLSSDGSQLYFVSNRRGGIGGYDIYLSKKDSIGDWSIPSNLGPEINTINDEIYPFVNFDNSVLYFASNGHFGLGGYDIFETYFNDTGWSTCQNLGRPFNDENDNYNFVIDARCSTGYSDSKVLPGEGNYDIFAIPVNSCARDQNKMIINILVTQPKDNYIENISVDALNLSNQKVVNFNKSALGDYYSAIVPIENTKFLIRVKAENALYSNLIIETMGKTCVYGNIALRPLTHNYEFKMENIKYDDNSASLDKNSMIILSDFGNYIRRNSNLSFIINGHYYSVTDGEKAKTNMETKTNAIYQTLIANGVSTTQLKKEIKDDFIRNEGKSEEIVFRVLIK